MPGKISFHTLYGVLKARILTWFAIPFSAAAAKLLQSFLTLCDPIDGSPPGSPVPGILQARTLEWVSISFSSVWKWKVKVKSVSRIRLLVTPWTAAYQASPSMGFSRQEYWSGLPFPSLVNHILSELSTMTTDKTDWLNWTELRQNLYFTIFGTWKNILKFHLELYNKQVYWRIYFCEKEEGIETILTYRAYYRA